MYKSQLKRFTFYKNGDEGRGIGGVIRQYYLSTSKVTPTGGEWKDEAPTWEYGKYLWIRDKISYTDGDTVYTTPYCDSSWEAVNEVDAQILAWCMDNDRTYINGAKIYTGSITADKLKVDSLESISANIGGIKISDGDLVCRVECDEEEGYWTDGAIAKGYTLNDDGFIEVYREWDGNTIQRTIFDDGTIAIQYDSGLGDNIAQTTLIENGFIFLDINKYSTDEYYSASIGHDYYYFGVLRITSTNAIVLNAHRFQNDLLCFYSDYTNALENTNRKGWIGYDGKNEFRMQNEAGSVLCLTANDVSLVADLISSTSTSNVFRMSSNATDKVHLGYSNTRWNSVYAKSGSVSTSDRNKKKNIQQLNDLYYELAKNIEIISYQFKDTEQADDVGRTHIGAISQQVEEVMQELGMTGKDFAGFCKDVKLKTEIDENGHEKFIPIEGEYDYSLRYDEIVMLKLWYLEETYKQQQKVIELLKEEVAKLKGE